MKYIYRRRHPTKSNNTAKCLPFDKIESIWYPFEVMSSRISLIVSCWYALNPKLETAPAVATNDIAPFKISNLRITTANEQGQSISYGVITQAYQLLTVFVVINWAACV